MRLDANGSWSHKSGATPARNRDDSDEVIDDPQNAKFQKKRGSPDYEFVCFMIANDKLVDVKGPSEVELIRDVLVYDCEKMRFIGRLHV